MKSVFDQIMVFYAMLAICLQLLFLIWQFRCKLCSPVLFKQLLRTGLQARQFSTNKCRTITVV